MKKRARAGSIANRSENSSKHFANRISNESWPKPRPSKALSKKTTHIEVDVLTDLDLDTWRQITKLKRLDALYVGKYQSDKDALLEISKLESEPEKTDRTQKQSPQVADDLKPDNPFR